MKNPLIKKELNPKHSLQGKCILIIEDNLELNEVLSYQLSAHGCQVLTAPEPKFGIRLALTNKIDLILLDINLPIMSGHETLAHLKTDAKTSSIPICIMTGDTTPRTAKIMKVFKVDSILQKPFGQRELFDKIERLLKLK